MTPEDEVYVALKLHLKGSGFKILGGQPPSGTDKFPVIEIKNRIGDEKGSKNSFKPDIIAVHDFEILVIEIKPKYSSSDQEKLLSFLVDPDRISAFWHEVELRRLVNDRGTQLQESNHSFIIHGALAYRGLPAQPCPLWQFVQDDSGEFRRFSPCPASLE